MGLVGPLMFGKPQIVGLFPYIVDALALIPYICHLLGASGWSKFSEVPVPGRRLLAGAPAPLEGL